MSWLDLVRRTSEELFGSFRTKFWFLDFIDSISTWMTDHFPRFTEINQSCRKLWNEVKQDYSKWICMQLWRWGSVQLTNDSNLKKPGSWSTPGIELTFHAHLHKCVWRKLLHTSLDSEIRQGLSSWCRGNAAEMLKDVLLIRLSMLGRPHLCSFIWRSNSLNFSLTFGFWKRQIIFLLQHILSAANQKKEKKQKRLSSH